MSRLVTGRRRRPARAPLRVVAAGLALGACLVATEACRGKTAPAVADAGTAPTSTVPLVDLPAGVRHPLWTRLPRDAAVALLIPHLAAAGRGFDRHLRPVLGALGSEGKVAAGTELTGLFDPFSASVRQAWGVEGKGAFAAVLLPDAAATLVVVPVSDAARFRKRLGQQAKTIAGAAVSAKTEGGITTLRAGQRVVLAFAPQAGSVAIAVPRAGADPRASLLKLTGVRASESLEQVAEFRAAVAPLGSLEDGLLYLSGDGLYQLQVHRAAALPEQEKSNLRQIFNVIRGVAIGARLDRLRPSVSAYVALGEAQSWKEVLPPGAGFALGRFIRADAAVALKVAVSGSALLDRLLSLAPRTRAQLERMGDTLARRLGIHLRRDLLRNLTGRFAVALLGIEPDLLERARDPARRKGALSALEVVLAVGLRRGAGLAGTLEQAAAAKHANPAAPRLQRQQRGKNVWYLLRSQKRSLASLAVVGDVLLATLGKGAMEKTLDLVGGRGPSLATRPPPAARAVLTGPEQVAAYVDGKRLRQLLQGIDYRPLGKSAPGLRKVVGQLIPAIFARGVVARARFDGRGVKLVLTRVQR